MRQHRQQVADELAVQAATALAPLAVAAGQLVGVVDGVDVGEVAQAADDARGAVRRFWRLARGGLGVYPLGGG